MKRLPILARSRKLERGQVLVLFALMIVFLLGAASLVVDVARVYSLQRYERSVADAAALAGAQDLQIKGTRNVTTAQYVYARTDAWSLLYRELGGTGAPLPNACADPNSDIIDCQIAGTPYWASVKTDPSPSVMTVDPNRAVQVTVHQPSVSLTFARLFGQTNWNVGITSVAGIDFIGQYAVITLRPPLPQKSGADGNYDDIDVAGGTQLNVYHGDIGTNTNMSISGSGTQVNLDPGYRAYHYDTYQYWSGPPKGRVIPNPIPDPNYTVPTESTGSPPTYYSAPDGQDTAAGCAAAVKAAIDAGYTPANWPALSVPGPLVAGSNTTCYMPGIYKYDLNNLQNSEVSLLEPGVYFFDNGLTIHASLIGGYTAGSPGVSLVFTEGTQCTTGKPNACFLSGNNSNLVALNMGACTPSSGVNCTDGAAPAEDFANNPVQVVYKGPGTIKTPVPESLIVTKDPNCYVATTEPLSCHPNSDNQNNVLNLPGGGNLYVAGVQYAPTDNVTITGSSGGSGYIGQIVAWTVKYSGNSAVSEFYPAGAGNGVLRLDTACSGPNTVCNP